jgi:cytochrome oxidase Cu insertion factor (SCO1/SenC/PrrC family)
MPSPPLAIRFVWLTLAVVLSAVTFIFVASRDDDASPEDESSVLQVPEISIPLPPFSLMERNEKTVTHEDLAGHIWIADFVFTYCAGPCPMMTRHMQRLQSDLKDVDQLRLVSFSVDPARDTPAVLRDYAQRHNADPQRWLFLSGPMDQIYDLAIDGFKITVEAARENRDIIHDTRFMLVDTQGSIRGYYDSTRPEELERLVAETRALASQE